STDPLLSALADNGGATKTCALLPGSPAIDAGNNTASPMTDQRGFFRYGTSSDIGAYEFGGTAPGVRALGPVASLDGNVGLFMFMGPGPPNGAPSPITINYTVDGTAISGTDYVAITNSVTIPAGETYAEILVRGIAGAFTGTNKTVTVTII